MKQGKFITCERLEAKSYEHAWHMHNRLTTFNSYEHKLEPGDGILTVKKSFEIKKKIRRVKVRATSLGIFDMFINGVRIGEDELKPGWTDYRIRVFEFEYDITEFCDEKNLFVAEVSTGWWTGRISFGFYGYRVPAFCGEIEITYTDGKREIIASGTDWDSAVTGPVLTAQIWDGEYFDSRIPHAAVKPEAHKWMPAKLFDYEGKIEPARGGSILHLEDISAISATVHCGTIDNGTDYGEINAVSKKVGDGCETGVLKKGQAMICDFGQNLVGRPIAKIKAKKGTRVELFVAEMLNDSGDKSRGNDGPKGSMYILNYRTALARSVYIANGEDDYVESRHSFYGFRYVEVRADDDVEIEYVVGARIGSDVYDGHISNFFCSDPEVNRLYSNIVNGMKGNYLSTATDCPQRDERLGWTGDTQVFSGAASYIGNTDEFLRKWLCDGRDSQVGSDGSYSDVFPRVLPGENHESNGAWADAAVIIPDVLYRMYNDTDVIKEHYASMESYMKYLTRFGLEGPNISYGDWLNYEITDKRYVSVCYYALDAALMEKYSRILGKTRREAHYRNLFKKLKTYWKKTYVKRGKLTVDTQTGYLLALRFNLVEGAMREKFIKRLEKKIIDNNYTLSTGFLGTGILCQTLDEVGLSDLCYSLLLQTADPSWLYSVRQGATTIWERWNSYTLEKGFGDVSMNSFNHYSYGAVAEWLYSGMCGIRPDPENPGFETDFVLCPTPDFRKFIPEGQKRITSAFADYDSITSGWEFVNDETVYSFEFYDGLTAHVSVVCPDGKLNVNGLDLDVSELGGRVENGRALFDLKEGYYKV
ncbi:MAG: family 78 glycoside hydrolase catalytic domain, partial [Firmicutes bacterium]|nr:family 78 glycoside hydrolase catalytic domain [Candidatus Colimorpha enterica]